MSNETQKPKGYIIGVGLGPVYIKKKDGTKVELKKPEEYKGSYKGAKNGN